MDPPTRPAPLGSASVQSPPSSSSFSLTSPRSMSQAAVSAGDTADATVSSVSARLSPSLSTSQRDAGTKGEGSASTQASMPDADERSSRSEKKGATAKESFEEPVEDRTNAREPENVNEKLEDEPGDKWRKLKVSRASKHALKKSSETEKVTRRGVEAMLSNRLSVSRLKNAMCLPTPETERPDRGSGGGEAARMRTRVIARRVHVSSSPKQSSQRSSVLSTGTPSPFFPSSPRRASGRSYVRVSPSPAPRSREVEARGTLSPASPPPATSEKVAVSVCRHRGKEETSPSVTRSQKPRWSSAASRRSESTSGRRNLPAVHRLLRSAGRSSPKTERVESDSQSRCRGDSSPSASSASSPMSGKGTCVAPRTPAPVSTQRAARMRSLRRPLGTFTTRRERATPSALSGSRPGLRSERRAEGSRSRRGVSPVASSSDAVLRDADEDPEEGDGARERLHGARRRLPVSARAGVSTRSSAAGSSSEGYVGSQGFPGMSEDGGTPPASPRTEPERRRGDRERPVSDFPGLRPRHLAPGEEPPTPRPGGVSPRSSPMTPEEREKVGTRRGYGIGGIGDGGRQKKAKTEAEKDDDTRALCGQNEERLVGSTPNERSPMRPILSFSPSSPARKKDGLQARDGFFGARWRVNAQTGLKELDPGPLGVDFHCNVCGVDVSVGQWRVRCAECDDFDLCVFCFARGRETGTHLNTHAYRPVPPNRQEIFAPNWTADEEQMLLEGVSRFGLGNWNDVASLVNRVALRAKTKQQCEQHYMSVYIDSGGIPAALWEQETPAPKVHSPPEASPSSLIFSPRRDASSDKDEAASPLQKAAGAGPRDGAGEDGGLLGSNGDTSATTPDGEAAMPQNAAKTGDRRHGDEAEQRRERAQRGENENRSERDERTEEEKMFGTLLADTESDEEESNQRTLAELQADSNSWHPPWIAKPVPPQPHHNNLQGYLPLRGDFDVEYDNHAEALLADMTIEPHESPSEKALKLSIVEAYNCRLDERIYRKRTILWRHWDDPKIANREKTGSLLERRYWQQLKPVQRFHNDSEHIALIRSLVTYAEAMERCRLLKEWRSLDLHTLQHVVDYEAEKQKRGAACRPAAFRSLFDAPSVSGAPSADDSLKATSAGILSDAPAGELVRVTPKSAVTSTSAERPSSLSAAAPVALLTETQAEKGEAREKQSSLSSSPPPSASAPSAAIDSASGTSRKGGRQGGPETRVKDGGPDEESEADAREQGLDEGVKAKKRGRDEELSEGQAHADGLERSEVDLCRALQLPPVLYQLVIQALKAQAQMLPTVEKDMLRKKRKRISTIGSLWDFDVRLDVEQKAGMLRDASSPKVILSSPGNQTVGSPPSPFAVSFASSVPPAAGQATDLRTLGGEAASSQRFAGGREASTSRASAPGDGPPLPGGSAQLASAQGLPQSETHAYEPNRQSLHPGYGASQNPSRLMSSPSPSAYTARSGSSLHGTPDAFASPGTLAPSPQVYGGASRSGPEAARGQTAHSASPPVSSLPQSFMHLHRQTLPGTHPSFAYSNAAYSHTVACSNGLQSFHPAAYSTYRSNGSSVDVGPSGYALSPAGFCGAGASLGPGVSQNGFYASRAYYGTPSGVPFLPQAPSLRAANTVLQRLQQQQQLQSFLLAAGRGGRPTAHLGWGQQQPGTALLGNVISTGSGAGVGGGHDFLIPSAHQNVANLSHMSPAYLAGNGHPYLSSLSYYGNPSNGAAMHAASGYGQLNLPSPFTAYQSSLLQPGASPSRQGGGTGPFLSQPNPGHRDLGAEAGAQGAGDPQGPGRRHPGMLASGGGTRIETSTAPSRLFQRENQMGSCRPAWPSGDSLAHTSNSLETDGDPLHTGQGLDRSERQDGETSQGDAACGAGERMKKATGEGTMGSDAEAQTGIDGAKIQASFSSGESLFASGPSVLSNTGSLRSVVAGLPAGSAGLCGPGGEGGGGALAERRKHERLRVPPDSQERQRAVPTTLSQEGKREEEREKWKEFVLHKLVPRVRGVRYDAVSHHWVAQWPAVFTASPFDSVQSFREGGVPPATLAVSVENSGETPTTRIPASGGPETEGATRSLAFSIKRLGFEGAWFQACEARRKEAEKARDWGLVAEVRAAETAAPSVFAALQDELPSLPFSSNDLASAFAGLSNTTGENKGTGGLQNASFSTGAKKDEVRDEEDRREKPGRRLPSAASPVPAAVKGGNEAGAGALSSLTRAAAHQLTIEGGLNSANSEVVFASPMAGLPRHAGSSRATDGLLQLRGSPPGQELIQASASTGKQQVGDEPVLADAQNAPRGVLQLGGQSLHVTSALASPGISGVGRERLLNGRPCVVKSLHGLRLERNGGACGGLGPWTGGGASAVGASLVEMHRRLPLAHAGKETPSPGIGVARKAMAASTVVAHANGGDGRAMLLATGLSPVSGGVKHRELPNNLAGGQFRAQRDDAKAAFCNGGASCNGASVSTLPAPALYATGKPRGFPGRGGGSTHAQSGVSGRGHGERRQGGSVGTGEEKNGQGSSAQPTLAWSDDDEGANSLEPSPAARKVTACRGSREASLATDRAAAAGPRGSSAQTVALPEGQRRTTGALLSSSVGAVERSVSETPVAEREASSSFVQGPGSLHASEDISDNDASQRQHRMWAGGPRCGVEGAREEEAGWARDDVELQNQSSGLERDKERQAVESEADTVEAARCDENREEGKGENVAVVDAHPTSRETTVSEGFACTAPPLLSASGQENETER
ncbi:AP2 domain transcription factor APVIIb-1/ADA2-B [Toxoplasma gondii ME49]|uniref:AP2 domain transcription factor APVIIb-1/ADA2-B n=1 Tax=Toxoplasma gondii (strain ATCC 50611 / Me49) TaxID=508771 RepID=S8GM57_TOXGM|nr:AP2 domain transcription factor APVIIb-1/ADA2-B [Toxoplasma gondii ME49]EPT29634.1 AP2 domain transcription factor APVIIb-1/ADA2-B [Toxoplasma gondii ME49]|eukprot:XP_002365344.2 AP2 domain transcription factor APVIIb-1/ADA2-B [Toxoplasma gondii ME49]